MIPETKICTNCNVNINTNPEFEYILDNSYSILLCKKCAIPINSFFSAFEIRGMFASNIYEAINQEYDTCTLCYKELSHKHYYRSKVKRHIVLCDKCNNIIEIYLKEVRNSGGKIRNFSLYTDRLNALVSGILKGEKKK